MTGLGKVMVTIKKWGTTQQDAGWSGRLIGLEWQAQAGEVTETWKWTAPVVDKGKKGKKVPKPKKAAPMVDEGKMVPKPKKAAPKRDKKKTAARAKKNKKNKAAMNPKGK